MAPSAVSPEIEATKPPGTVSEVARPVVGEKQEQEQECFLDSLCIGPNPLTGIPHFDSLEAHREHILVHMAAVFRNWARVGFTEGISGHISVRDPEYPECIWMNPIGKHFALLNASDMVCLEINSGRIVGGNKVHPVNRPGYLIHSEVHKARPDIHAICHAHTIAGRAWTAFGKPLDMITQDVCDFYGVLAAPREYTGIVAAEEEGRQIAEDLGTKNKAALLLNHGLITVGSTVDEAAFLIGLLDRSCEIQLRVEAACSGNPTLKKKIISHELASFNYKMVSEKNWLYVECQPDIQYEIAMAGEIISSGVENMRVDAY